MNLDIKINKIWDKAKKCNCGVDDCYQNHKLCAICSEKMIYTAHESNQPTSIYAWNIDHIKPKSYNGNSKINNLQAVHINCNRIKNNTY